MTYTTKVSVSASFSDKLVTQKASTYWESPLIRTSADLNALEDIVDIFTAVEAKVLYREQGRNAFVSFEELKRSRE